MPTNPPPSFSSFPAPPRQEAPSFASFPSPTRPSASTSTEPVRKRGRASHFLDEIGAELGIERDRPNERKSRREGDDRSRHHRHHSRNDDDDRSRSSKGKERERERDRDSGRSRDKGSGTTGHRSKRDRGHERDEDRRRGVSDRRGDGARDRDRKRTRDDGDVPSHLVQPSSGATDEPSSLAAPVVIEERRAKPLFYESRRGDDLNVAYGALHRGDVSRYRRQGAGRVLGLNDGLRITRDTAHTGRGVEIAPLNRYKTPRYIDPASARHLNDKNAKRVALMPRRPPPRQILGESPGPPPPPSLPSDDVDALFISFLPEKSEAEKLEALEHEEGAEYRSIAGAVKPSDLDSGSDDDDDLFGGLGVSGGESQDEYLKRRNVEIDRALRDDPSNVAGWLEFVDFQDEVAQSSFVGSSTSASYKRALSKNERTSTAEIKLAILRRALDTPGNEESEPLLLAYLKAAALVEDPKKILQRWKETLKEHPSLTGLWIEYVSWRQTSWVNFAVNDVVEVFEECLDVLMLAMLREDVGSTDLEVIEGNAIYLFLRLCLMLRQAGYSERALAAFQGLVELNLYRPDRFALERPNAPRRKWTDQVIDELEEFWDSEVPRIGEKGAKGWKSATEDDLPPEDATTHPFETSNPDPSARPFETWAAAERTASLDSRPVRTTDPCLDDSDDPFRAVLFDDIRSFLFVVHSPDSKLQLAYAFLTFLGLPFVPPDVPTSTPFTTDSFIHSELVERPNLIKRFWPSREEVARPFGTIGGEPMEPERRGALESPFDVPFHATPASVDLLFATGPRTDVRWFATIGRDDLVDIDLDLARNAVETLRRALPDPFLTLDLFALEAAFSPKGAVKVAKQVLRDHRQDLALWDGYARIERQRGKIVEARQVYCTALSMYRSFKREEQIDGPLLWRAWAEMEWEEGNDELAVRVLVAATSEDKLDLGALAKADSRPTPPQILRARQIYTTQLEASFQPRATQSIVRNRNHIAYSAAILSYLTQNLERAVDVLERHLFRLDASGNAVSAEVEEVYMMYAKLLYRHSRRGGFKPVQMRDLMERSIKEFKNNTLFLSLFYHNELRMKLQNRIRKTLEDLVLKEKDATSEGYLFAIFAELHLDARSHNVWAARNLFDRAIDNPNTKSSPSLWTLYIDFEVRNGELERAKSLIYRALRECPWCKEFYLRPFSPTLRSVYRSSELRDFHHLLLEKGLRVRVDLEPFLGGAVYSDVEMLGIEDEEDGEVGVGEEVFEERKKLMPY
ncbi:hypothetical protein JCM10212_006990 [Sporobolomyces blumeae]